VCPVVCVSAHVQHPRATTVPVPQMLKPDSAPAHNNVVCSDIRCDNNIDFARFWRRSMRLCERSKTIQCPAVHTDDFRHITGQHSLMPHVNRTIVDQKIFHAINVYIENMLLVLVGNETSTGVVFEARELSHSPILDTSTHPLHTPELKRT